MIKWAEDTSPVCKKIEDHRRRNGYKIRADSRPAHWGARKHVEENKINKKPSSADDAKKYELPSEHGKFALGKLRPMTL
jgi:hypothetical protein